MSYFDFIHDTEDADTWKKEEMDLVWSEDFSEKENSLCDIWENYANALLEAVRNFRETIGG